MEQETTSDAEQATAIRRDAGTTLEGVLDSAPITKRQGYFLPHWTLAGAIYNVCFRQRDSLPDSVLGAFEEERQFLRRRALLGELSQEEASRLDYLVSERVEEYLDAGHGSCLMSQPDIASLVEGALRFFDGRRYWLHCWCVMPNHVHVIVEPLPAFELAHILHSWKSFTSHEIDKRLGPRARSGRRSLTTTSFETKSPTCFSLIMCSTIH